MAFAARLGCLAATALTLSLAAASDAGIAPELRASYRLKLGRFAFPPAGQVGLLMRGRINGGPPLRLLLDSGTQALVVDRKTAARSDLAGGSHLDLVEPGGPPALVKTLTADTLDINGLILRRVPTLVTDRPLPNGIDGALPLSLFSGFLIRLDIPSLTLDLVPYAVGPLETSGAIPAIASNDLLFLQAVFENSRPGYFLLDTGAAYNAISQNLNRQSGKSTLFTVTAGLRSGTDVIEGDRFPDSATLRFGGLRIAAQPLVSIDLSTISRYHNLEVAGLIGFPALRNSVLTISYRDTYVRIEPR